MYRIGAEAVRDRARIVLNDDTISTGQVTHWLATTQIRGGKLGGKWIVADESLDEDLRNIARGLGVGAAIDDASSLEPNELYEYLESKLIPKDRRVLAHLVRLRRANELAGGAHSVDAVAQEEAA
jgi:hypothetical protein